MQCLVIWLGLATACSKPIAVTTEGGVLAARGIPWLPHVELVAFDGGDVVGYAVTDALIEVGRLRVADAEPGPSARSGEWADHDDLIIKAGAARVVRLTAEGMTAIRVPSESELAAPQPATENSTEGSIELQSGGDADLVVVRGAAYWSRCAWGLPVDGLQCEVYVHAELWPSPSIKQTDRRLSLVKIAWQELPAPGGVRTEVAGSVLHCRPPSGAEVELAGNAETSEQIYGVHWVSASPPRLLVEYGVSGFADMLPSTWSLYEACGPTAIAKGTRVEPGSHGLWAGEEADPDGSSRAVIWRGGTRIGALPRGDGFRFRPAPGAP